MHIEYNFHFISSKQQASHSPKPLQSCQRKHWHSEENLIPGKSCQSLFPNYYRKACILEFVQQIWNLYSILHILPPMARHLHSTQPLHAMQIWSLGADITWIVSHETPQPWCKIIRPLFHQACCHGLNVCLPSPPNSYADILTSNVIVLRDRVLRR